MDLHEAWEKALRSTEILRLRIQPLSTSATTQVPYFFLSESIQDHAQTLVRKGMVLVEKPSIILPPNVPQFEGFDFAKDSYANEESVINFLLVRGVSIPSMKYQNQTFSIDKFQGKLSQAIDYYLDYLEQKEDVSMGLVAGAEDLWTFSILIFICSQIAKSANQDIKKLLDEYKKGGS